MLNSGEARAKVRRSESRQRQRKNRKLFPCVYVEGKRADSASVAKWWNQWENCDQFLK